REVPRAVGRRGARRTRRQPVPLYRLPEDRRCCARGGGAAAQGVAERPAAEGPMRAALARMDVVRPRDLKQALRAMADGDGDRPMPVAGGTDLLVYLNAGQL